MNSSKIIPNLWVTADEGKLKHVLEYYQSVFGSNMKIGSIIPLGNTPSGYSEMCEIEFFGQKFLWMCTAEMHHPFNDSISFMIQCDDQQEIDKFWDYFTKEGSEAPCGWCMDKYGLRWQIVPKNLGELMNRDNAMNVMMKQTKIIIDEYYAI